jgi:hypothetical protein
VITVEKQNLSDAVPQEVEELTKYGDIFAVDRGDYGWTDRVYRHIGMGEAQPIRQPHRKLPVEKQVDMGEMFNDMQ